MRIKSDWRLIRLGDKHAEYDLNDGETKIGRSVKSQIRTESEICSRVHCTLAIDANGKITLEDKVCIIQAARNSTYYENKLL